MILNKADEYLHGERYQYEKTDYDSANFNFQEGDYLLYFTDKSAAQV